MTIPNSLLGIAIAIASEGHKDQLDKGGKPYILHPLKVMYYLKSDDTELNCIAVLHDYIEDVKGATYSQLIDYGMTPRIIAGIQALTKLPGQSHEEYMTAILSNQDAMKVKLCDLRHNMDVRRLKGVSAKDLARVEKYQKMYLQIKNELNK